MFWARASVCCRSERVRQRLRKNLEMQTKIAVEARASVKGSEAIIKDGGVR